jgi:hypothetical protein
MASNSNSIILKNPPSCEELLPQVEAVIRPLTQTLDLFFVYEERIDRAPGVVVHVWWEPLNPKLDIRLVCDDLMKTRYLNVTGPDKDQRQRILYELEKHFETVAAADLYEQVRNHGDDVNAWLRLALGVRREPDEEALQLLVSGLQSPDVGRRNGAAQASAMFQWPELGNPVRQALARETDPATIEALKVAAQVCNVSPSNN